MAVRPVVAYPHPVLKRVAEPVGRVNEGLRALARDLVDTMRQGPATVGLAAPQVGESVRVFVLDVTVHPRAGSSHGLVILFDPHVIDAADAEVRREGCLSVPHLTANVSRALRVSVDGLDEDGRRRAYHMEGFEARAVQHEIDHLDGLLILDRVAAASELFPRKVYG
jgi:peptide deformylase